MVAKPRNLLQIIGGYIPVLIIVVLFVFPLFWMLSTSFKQRVDWYALPPRFAFDPTLDNYDQLLAITVNQLHVVVDTTTGEPKINKLTNEPLLERPSEVFPTPDFHEMTRVNLFGQWYVVGIKNDFIHFVFNSILISLGAMVFSVIMACLTAYGFSRFPPKRSDNILFWILSLRMLPPVAVIVPYFYMFQALSMLDSPVTLILVYSVFNISFGVWLLKGFFDEVSPELEEAAIMDGYGPWAVFRKVALPMVIPGIATVAVFNIIQSINEFLLAFVLTSHTATTGPVGLAKFVLPTGVDWGEIAAAATLLVVPVIVFTIVVRNHLIRGMSFGQLR